MDRKNMEQLVVNNEWNMFQKVQGIDGRAPCQAEEQYQIFVIMRLSQFESWPLDVVESYLQDLEDAKAAERNLVMEKYARMMEETDPRYYAEIQRLLPEISEEARLLAEKITAQYMRWEREVNIQYPNVRKHGRQAAGTSLEGDTSLENYLRSELLTYSSRTLRLFWNAIEADSSKNLYRISMEKLASAYGYASLEEAEKALS